MKAPVDKKVLDTVIKGFISRLEKTEKFVLDQAPDICKQMVQESLFDNIMDLALNIAGGVVLLAIASFLASRAFSYADFDHCFPYGVGAVISGVFGLTCMGCCVETLKKVYLVKYCPKLFLLREFRKLL